MRLGDFIPRFASDSRDEAREKGRKSDNSCYGNPEQIGFPAIANIINGITVIPEHDLLLCIQA